MEYVEIIKDFSSMIVEKEIDSNLISGMKIKVYGFKCPKCGTFHFVKDKESFRVVCCDIEYEANIDTLSIMPANLKTFLNDMYDKFFEQKPV